jgi:hypothetical protein
MDRAEWVGKEHLVHTTAPLFFPLARAAAGTAHRESPPHQQGVWGTHGALLPGGAGGVPAEVGDWG